MKRGARDGGSGGYREDAPRDLLPNDCRSARSGRTSPWYGRFRDARVDVAGPGVPSRELRVSQMRFHPRYNARRLAQDTPTGFFIDARQDALYQGWNLIWETGGRRGAAAKSLRTRECYRVIASQGGFLRWTSWLYREIVPCAAADRAVRPPMLVLRRDEHANLGFYRQR